MNCKMLLLGLASITVLAAFSSAEPEKPQAIKDLWPRGEAPVQQIRDGYIVSNGKPFFRNYDHGWYAAARGGADTEATMTLLRIYRYYLLTNTVTLAVPSRFMAWDLEQKGAEETFKDPMNVRAFAVAAAQYKHKVLAGHNLTGLQYFVERVNGYKTMPLDEMNTKFSALITGSSTQLARLWKDHPALGCYLNQEEIGFPSAGDWRFHPSQAMFIEFLKRKHGNLEKVNTAWGTNYASFEDIPQLPYSGAFGWPANLGKPGMDWADFLMVDTGRRMRLVYDAIKKENPGALVVSAKGHISGDQYFAPACDVFSWLCAVGGCKGIFTANLAQPREIAERFGKSLEFVHYDFCRMARHDRPWKEGEKFPIELRDMSYPHVLSDVFEGMKSQWLEDYDNEYYHYFHPTKILKAFGEQTIPSWNNTKLYMHPDGLEGPDVVLEPSTLGMSHAFAWCQRAAPVFLPTRVELSNVAAFHSDPTYYGQGYYENSLDWRDLPEAMRRLHVQTGLIRDGNLADLDKFDVLIAGATARDVSPKVVEAVKAFVARGGKLILMPRAFTQNEYQFPRPEVRVEMEKLAAVKLENLPRFYDHGLTRVRKGTTGNFDRVDSDNWSECLAKYQAALDAAGAKVPAQITAEGGLDATSMLLLGMLKGKGYWIVGIASFDSAADRNVTLKLNSLPQGQYEVVDITGEYPLMVPDKMAGYALKPDPEHRPAKIISRSVTAEELRKTGLPGIEVKSGMARIFLVRPAGETVIVSCPEYEVNAIALRKVGVDVVVPADTSAGLRAAAESLVKTINAKGGNARTVSPDAVRIENTRFDATFVRSTKIRKITGEVVPVSYSYTMEVFENKPLATDRNLIVIGSEATNPLMKHLGAVNTFTYDKVLEKITADYPGPGRGLIGVVESVNDPSFDPTDQTRDALLIGGSDEQGTLAAVEKLGRIITEAQ